MDIQVKSVSGGNAQTIQANIRPFRFEGRSGNDIRYLAANPNDPNQLAWLIPPKVEAPSTVAKDKSPPQQVAGVPEKPVKAAPKVNHKLREEVVPQSIQADRKVQSVKEEKGIKFAALGASAGELFSKAKKKIGEEYDILQKKADELARLSKLPDSPQLQARKEELDTEIEAQRVAVMRAEQEQSGVDNLPKTGERFSVPEKKVFDERIKAIAEQEKLVEAKRRKASPQQELSQRIKVVEQELSLAKAERAALSRTFGDRYVEPTMNQRRVMRRQGRGDQKYFDTYTPQQRSQFSAAHKKVQLYEKRIAELKRQQVPSGSSSWMTRAILSPLGLQGS